MKKFMTREEIMRYFNISRPSLIKWEKEGLPFIDKGRNSHYYKDTDIEKFMDESRTCAYEQKGEGQW